jgi:hypothetical protein
MKKEYLKPEITIVTFSSSVRLMAGSLGANSQANPVIGSAPEFELEDDF